MRRLDKMVLAAKNRIAQVAEDVEEKVMVKRDGDAKVIVSAVLIVIAIALCVTFRTALQNWLTTLISYFENDLKVFTIPNS